MNISDIFQKNAEQKTFFDNKDSKNRFCLLDLLRFIACIAVIFWHYQHFFYIEPGILISGFSREQQPLYNCFSIFYRYGQYGVPIFWALSGFVFFALFANKIAEKKLSWKVYLVDRFSRLYPLHILSLLLVAFSVWRLQTATGNSGIYPHNDLYHFFTNLFLVPYILPHRGWSFNAPVWSLSLELIFYVVFFLYARFLKTSLVKNIIFLGVFFFLFKYCPGKYMLPEVFRCGIYFFLGGTVFFLLKKTSEHLNLFAVYGISCVCLVAGFYVFKHELWVILLLLTLFSYPMLLPHKWSAFFLFLGNTTYSMYMLHIFAQLTVMYIFKVILKVNLCEYARKTEFLIIYLILLFIISALSYYYFENPQKKLIRNYLIDKKLKV